MYFKAKNHAEHSVKIGIGLLIASHEVNSAIFGNHGHRELVIGDAVKAGHVPDFGNRSFNIKEQHRFTLKGIQRRNKLDFSVINMALGVFIF